jgi:citrate synthase
MASPQFSDGLESISVARTALSDVDGQLGRLTLRGYDIEELAGAIRFETACHLLWTGNLPADEAAVRERIGLARRAAFRALPALGDALRMTNGMDALRAAVAHLTLAPDSPPLDAYESIVAAIAVFAAAWHRYRQGEQPIAPRPELRLAEDFLRMALGHGVEPARADALEDYFVTVSDHGMNASTFTCRVVASTGSDLVSAVVAAIGALKGPLHGGAPGPVLDMLDAIGSTERAEQWIETELQRGQRIMGMGHRVYRVRDPRAAVLERSTLRLEQAGITTGRLPLARAVETAARGHLQRKYPTRDLAANVEFYTAVLLDTIGLPRSLFSPAFAIGRASGWCAHFGEQQSTGRLIRPASDYVGPRGLTLGAKRG